MLTLFVLSPLTFIVCCCTGSAGGGADSFEKRKAISSIRDENMGMNDKPDYVGLKSSVSYIKHDNDCWYTACPFEGCNKKVSTLILINISLHCVTFFIAQVNETMNNNWMCEKCNKEYPNVSNLMSSFVIKVTLILMFVFN